MILVILKYIKIYHQIIDKRSATINHPQNHQKFDYITPVMVAFDLNSPARGGRSTWTTLNLSQVQPPRHFTDLLQKRSLKHGFSLNHSWLVSRARKHPHVTMQVLRFWVLRRKMGKYLSWMDTMETQWINTSICPGKSWTNITKPRKSHEVKKLGFCQNFVPLSQDIPMIFHIKTHKLPCFC